MAPAVTSETRGLCRPCAGRRLVHLKPEPLGPGPRTAVVWVYVGQVAETLRFSLLACKMRFYR